MPRGTGMGNGWPLGIGTDRRLRSPAPSLPRSPLTLTVFGSHDIRSPSVARAYQVRAAHNGAPVRQLPVRPDRLAGGLRALARCTHRAVRAGENSDTPLPSGRASALGMRCHPHLGRRAPSPAALRPAHRLPLASRPSPPDRAPSAPGVLRPKDPTPMLRQRRRYGAPRWRHGR